MSGRWWGGGGLLVAFSVRTHTQGGRHLRVAATCHARPPCVLAGREKKDKKKKLNKSLSAPASRMQAVYAERKWDAVNGFVVGADAIGHGDEDTTGRFPESPTCKRSHLRVLHRAALPHFSAIKRRRGSPVRLVGCYSRVRRRNDSILLMAQGQCVLLSANVCACACVLFFLQLKKWQKKFRPVHSLRRRVLGGCKNQPSRETTSFFFPVNVENCCSQRGKKKKRKKQKLTPKINPSNFWI